MGGILTHASFPLQIYMFLNWKSTLWESTEVKHAIDCAMEGADGGSGVGGGGGGGRRESGLKSPIARTFHMWARPVVPKMPHWVVSGTTRNIDLKPWNYDIFGNRVFDVNFVMRNFVPLHGHVLKIGYFRLPHEWINLNARLLVF